MFQPHVIRVRLSYDLSAQHKFNFKLNVFSQEKNFAELTASDPI